MTINGIISRASRLFGVSRAEIVGPSRARYVCETRFAVVWAARRALGQSSVVIGRALGDRDHSTILHALKRAELLRTEDALFRKRCALLAKPAAKSLFRSTDPANSGARQIKHCP